MRICASVAAALLLAACGGPGKKTTASAESTTASTQTTPSTNTSTTATTATSQTSSTTTSASSLCRAANLDLSFLGQQGATGHGELGFALRVPLEVCLEPVAAQVPGACRSKASAAKSGGALPTVPAHTTHDFAGQAPLVSLIVPPGGSVSFRLGVTHGVVSSAGCTTASGLQVIPPNDTATLRVGITDGAFECRTVTVSPLRPGRTAYP